MTGQIFQEKYDISTNYHRIFLSGSLIMLLNPISCLEARQHVVVRHIIKVIQFCMSAWLFCPYLAFHTVSSSHQTLKRKKKKRSSNMKKTIHLNINNMYRVRGLSIIFSSDKNWYKRIDQLCTILDHCSNEKYVFIKFSFFFIIHNSFQNNIQQLG